MDYEEIVKRLRNIVENPPIGLSETKVKEIMANYRDKCPRSEEAFDEAKRFIPGGVEHNLSLNKPFPITMDKAEGCKVWDIDGNEYIDYLMCGGPILLGHNYSPLRDKILEIIQDKGPSHGVTSEYEVKAIKLINKYMPSIEMFRFLQSGTEAAMAAIRIARVYTDKTKIIKIGGSYHGWADQMVYGMHIPGTGPLEASGIPKGCWQNTIEVPPNSEKKLKRAFRKAEEKGGVAAVFLEPVGGESGTHPVHPDWNKIVREYCDEYGALLVFDEVVTGFRMGMGGAQGYFNVKPDLTMMGKIIGHGYPSAGGVGGRRAVMSVCAGGVEGVKKKAYTGGTLAANPITTAACYWTIKFLEETNGSDKAAAAADKIAEGMNDLFGRADLPFFVYNFRSIIHYETTSFFAVRLSDKDALNQIMNRRRMAEEYQAALIINGVYPLAGTRMYTCMAHDAEAIDKTLKAWDNIVKMVKN
ncbi:MAG: aminotransferase class III-fold pyridoxal phosphate-dependent enzyme [Candidatus Helarchaeota archaeon]|nr:aminotransferase class III-fold pyridoxal phosphate-dependent enzyme [Candidatus Helarchaeota archaeon]